MTSKTPTSRRKARLNDTQIRKLEAESANYTVWDTGVTGLGVKVAPTGRKVFQVAYSVRVNGVRAPERRFTIGAFPAWTTEVARREAAEIRLQADQGIDFQEKIREQALAAELDKSNLFENVLAEFIEKHAKQRQKCWAETKRVLSTNCSPWNGRDIRQLTKKDCYRLLDKYVEAGFPSKAAVTLRWIKCLWNWAEGRDIINANPMRTVNIAVRTKQRNRVYTPDELRCLWLAADKLDWVRGDYLKMLMLTAVRKNELAGMVWNELDDCRVPQTWVIPASRAKSSRLHKPVEYVTPLTNTMKEILISSRRRNPDRKFVFESRVRRNGSGAIELRAISPTAPLQRLIAEHSGVSDFGFHSLRHSAASVLEDKGCSPYERSLLLNHSVGLAVTHGYSHGNARHLKLTVLETWGDYLLSLV